VDYSMWSILQEKLYKTRITDLDDLSNITSEPSGPSLITPSLLPLCVRCGVVIFQLVSERGMVISSTAFNSVCFCDNCGLWSLHWLVESNSRKLIFWSDFLPVVSHDVVHFNKWRSFNSQGKVVTLIRCGGLCCVSLVSHYLSDIPCKNYGCVFVFVKVMPKILLVPFFSGHGVEHEHK